MTPDSRAAKEGRQLDLICAGSGGEVCVPDEDRPPEEVTRQCTEGDRQPPAALGAHRTRPLTLGESAIYLNLTERYMRRLVAERRIRFLKVGRLLRFRAVDLDAYFESCVVDAVARR